MRRSALPRQVCRSSAKYEGWDAPQTLVEKWAYFFREARDLDVVPPSLSEGPFRGALEVTRKTAFTPEEWELYERAKMAEQDARGALVIARDEGHQSGVVEGRAEGATAASARAVLAVLRARGIAVTDAAGERILAEKDLLRLERWLEKAATAASIAEVIGEPS